MNKPFSWNEWAKLGARDLVEHVRRGDVTADEVAAQARLAALALEPELGALVEVFDSPAIAADVPVDHSAQNLLTGLPLFLKDLGSSVAGVKRELGSSLHRDEVVPRTDPLTAAWLREGAQILGRATTAELGMAYDTTTVYRGLQVTRNPWDPKYTAGGSSGGSAALVAAGVVPVAHATDGAGSIRLPAAVNGLIGLKVTRGRLPPLWGANELSNATFVEGVVSRSLEDTALLLDAATRWPAPVGNQYVPLPRDPTNTLAVLAERKPRVLRVGVTTSLFGRSDDRSPDHVQAPRRAADALALAGHQVEEVPERDLPDWGVIFDAFETFWVGVRAGSWRLRAEFTPAKLEGLSPVARVYHEQSVNYQKLEILRYLNSNANTTRAFANLLERYDVLLLPAFPYATPAANGAFSTCREHAFSSFVQRFLDAGRYTIPASIAGLPALTLPAGFDTRGLPLAVQLYGRFRGEAELLRAGQILQELLGVEARTPTLHVSRLNDG